MRFQSFFRERRRELDFMQRSICVYLEIIRGEERIQRWEGKRINSFHCSSSSVITAAEGSVVTTGEARCVCSWAFQHCQLFTSNRFAESHVAQSNKLMAGS